MKLAVEWAKYNLKQKESSHLSLLKLILFKVSSLRFSFANWANEMQYAPTLEEDYQMETTD